MIARLILFILGYGVILLIPGGALALLGYKLLKPRLERRRKLKAAEERAKYLKAISVDTTRMCSICIDFVDIDKDCYQQPHGWFHAACMTRLLKGEDK